MRCGGSILSYCPRNPHGKAGNEERRSIAIECFIMQLFSFFFIKQITISVTETHFTQKFIKFFLISLSEFLFLKTMHKKKKILNLSNSKSFFISFHVGFPLVVAQSVLNFQKCTDHHKYEGLGPLVNS